MQEQQSEAMIQTPSESFFEKIKRYKIHFSIAAAVIVVGTSALAHYKNERVKRELVASIAQYQKNLFLVGGEMTYSSIDCSGIFSTNCEIKGIKLSLLGQEQLSMESLRIGDIDEFGAFKKLSEGESIKASIDIEAESVALPKTVIAQMVAQNVSNAFQQNTLEKLSRVNLELKGKLEGDKTMMKRIVIDRFLIDNAIMPIRFSMEARNVSSITPDSMVLEHFSLSAKNRSLSDVTYESVKSFVDPLKPEEKELFLKEFGLSGEEMSDKKKASSAINAAMAKRFEADLADTHGAVEKELIEAIIAVLKGEASEIILEGKNQKELSVAEIQNALSRSSAMSEAEAQKFMADKFTIKIESD